MDVLMPKRTKGKWSIQVPEPEEVALAISLSLRVLCCLSMMPLLCGWYEVVVRWLMPSREQSSDQRPEVN